MRFGAFFIIIYYLFIFLSLNANPSTASTVCLPIQNSFLPRLTAVRRAPLEARPPAPLVPCRCGGAEAAQQPAALRPPPAGSLALPAPPCPGAAGSAGAGGGAAACCHAADSGARFSGLASALPSVTCAKSLCPPWLHNNAGALRLRVTF